MPTIVGSKSGTRPYLELDWSVNSQDIANNRSSVKLKLYLKVDYSISYSARYTGTLYGASFTSSSGRITSPGRYLLTQRDVWIGHNSDGSKTVNLTADYNLNITWGGTYHGKISLSGNANLGTIPRASTLSAFSFGAHLKNGVANSINYTVDRKSGNFRHQIQLRDGSTTIWTWDNQNTNGSNSITLTASNVNTLLNRMSSSTTKSFTLRVATRSGSGGSWIGSAVSRNATATVHADVKPTVGAVSLSQTGNSVSSHYLQGKSKVKASFTRSAGYGASITSSSIQVRRVSGGADSQTINSNDGTTNNPVTLNGSYEARGIATDSRGRFTHTAWATFTVTAYSAPRITNFSAVRSSSAETTIVVTRNGTHTSLGNANSARMLIQKRTGTGAWTTVEDKSDAGGSWGGSVNDTGNSTTISYDFRATLTDAFGESATATVTVSTQRVVLDIHKNEGVGIGKIHERGVLDVNGDAYVDGKLETTGSVTVDGDLNVRTSVIGNLMTYKNTNRSIAQINAVDNSSDRWNSEGRSSLKLRNNNNALSFIVGGTQNNRQSIIQGGHSDGPFAQHLSSLHINKLGGMTYIGAGLSVTGSKNAIHVTRDGFRATPAYEMAESFLGDIGSGKSDEKGIAKIYIDVLFSDTINTEHEYHVFLQEHSSSRAWVKERNKDHFVVETETPNTSFSWELKAKRRGYENDRLKLDDVLQLSDISNMQELSGAPRELEKVEKTM